MSNENVKILLEKIQKKLQKSAFKDLAIVEKMNEQFENKLMEQDNNIDFNDFIKNIETDTNPASQAMAKKLRVAYLYINLDEPIIRVNVEAEVKAVEVLPEVKPVVPASVLENVEADKVAKEKEEAEAKSAEDKVAKEKEEAEAKLAEDKVAKEKEEAEAKTKAEDKVAKEKEEAEAKIKAEAEAAAEAEAKIKADKVAQTEAASGAPVVSPAPGPGPSEIGAAPVIPPGIQAALQSAGPAGGQAALPPGIQSALASLGTGPAGAQGTGPAGAQGTGPAGIPGLAGLMSGTGGQGTEGQGTEAQAAEALAAAEKAAPIATGFAKSAAKFAGIKIPT